MTSGRIIPNTLAWLMTPVHLLVFLGILIIFHPILVLSKFISDALFRKTVVLINRCVIWNNILTAGVRYDVRGAKSFDLEGPVIIVSNHQSTYDIPLFIVHFSSLKPSFVSKIELSKWIPTISFAIRNMDSIIIDRSRPREAAQVISDYASRFSHEKLTVVLFPEGTRARNGVMKDFKETGLKILLESAPQATVIPVVLDGNWELLKNNFLPVPWGVRVHFRILTPIPARDLDPEFAATVLQGVISGELERLRSGFDS